MPIVVPIILLSQLMQPFAIRFKPDQDLKQCLQAFVLEHQMQAGYVLSAIGSLKQATIRFADQPTSSVLSEKLEILALNGTLSVHGLHLHITLANQHGQTIGGHLDRGCLIYTTAEIVIAEIPDLVFLRTPDEQTGFLELEIKARSTPDG